MRLELLPDGLDGALVHVNEECAEVIQEICKVQRFGLESFHPDEPEKGNNRTRLLTEMRQLQGALDRLLREIGAE
jgi:hypothetical protein